MSEVIHLPTGSSDTILRTQVELKLVTYISLMEKTRDGTFTADPPIILTPMPSFYRGNFQYHIYNGNNRYVAAGQKAVALNGLVVACEEDIPDSERLKYSISERLRVGLFFFLERHTRLPGRWVDHSLESLIDELEHQEACGLTKGPLTLAFSEE